WNKNPALWSLGYEWALYLLAPLVLGLVLRAPAVQRLAALAFLGAAIAAVCDDQAWPFWFAAWFIGVAASHVHRAGRMPLTGGLAGIALLMIGMAVARLKIVNVELTDCIIALGTALAISSPTVARLSIAPGFFAWAASFSYSLYAVHMPIIFV